MSDENKIVTDNDEIKEFGREVLGHLDSPLVVHKKSDASYEESTTAFEMNETHNEEERPTLTRHRFKKEKKGKGKLVFVLALLVVLAAVFAALYYTGNITFDKKETTAPTTQTTTETTTNLQQQYAGTIVVKDMYIFVNGVEVSGIEGLQDEIKYDTPSPTAYRIIDEGANADFLNYEILPLLEQLGFYGKTTEITHIESTGLMAAAETTTAPPSTTAPTTQPPTTE